MLGILLYFITLDITESIQKKEFILLKYLSIQNILSIFLLFPIFLFYYLTNAAISNNEFPLLNNSISPFFRTRYILFVLLEFLCYIVLIFQHKNLKSIIIITIYLLAIPFVNHADFVMRVSIPFIFALFIHIIEFIFDKNTNQKRKLILLIVLIIASINPLFEIIKNIDCAIKQGHLKSDLQEKEIIELEEGHFNYITNPQPNIFFDYLAKEAKL